MNFAQAFAGIATSFSAAMGGPFFDATVRWPGTPVLDDGGSIIAPGSPTELPCQCQVDVATEAMRGESGYRDKDVALIVLGLVALDTDAVVDVCSGPSPGRYSVQSVSRDAMGVGWTARGRRA